MERDAFAPSQRTHVVRAEGGHLAFVPPALPPDVPFDRELIATLSAADRAIGELACMGRTLPNPEILTAPIVRREAVLSSQIEGTRASVDQLALFELDQVAEADGDVREVYNYLAALSRVLAPDRRLPLSLPLLLEAGSSFAPWRNRQPTPLVEHERCSGFERTIGRGLRPLEHRVCYRSSLMPSS